LKVATAKARSTVRQYSATSALLCHYIWATLLEVDSRTSVTTPLTDRNARVKVISTGPS
jgi:hypothetical protein